MMGQRIAIRAKNTICLQTSDTLMCLRGQRFRHVLALLPGNADDSVSLAIDTGTGVLFGMRIYRELFNGLASRTTSDRRMNICWSR